jgi:acyl carrier protein
MDTRRKTLDFIGDRLRRIGIREEEIRDDFDLVRTGLMNSLEFVDLVSSLEKESGREIDFEEALEKGDLTTLGGLLRVFKGSEHA